MHRSVPDSSVKVPGQALDLARRRHVERYNQQPGGKKCDHGHKSRGCGADNTDRGRRLVPYIAARWYRPVMQRTSFAMPNLPRTRQFRTCSPLVRRAPPNRDA